MTTILFLIVSGFNSAAQLLLKKGSLLLNKTLASGDSAFIKIIKILTNPFVAGAITLLAVGMIMWIKILSRAELSRAYPINIALTVIITSVVSIFLFQESITLLKSFGIALVIVGIWAILVG